MPKLIPRPEDIYKNQVLSKIEYEYSRRGISKKQQEQILHCSTPTYNSKRKDPGKLTLNDLIRISTKLKIPVSELVKEVS